MSDPKPVVCDSCAGSGASYNVDEPYTTPCEKCGGEGSHVVPSDPFKFEVIAERAQAWLLDTDQIRGSCAACEEDRVVFVWQGNFVEQFAEFLRREMGNE